MRWEHVRKQCQFQMHLWFSAVNHVCERLGLVAGGPGELSESELQRFLGDQFYPGPLQGLQRRCGAGASPDSRWFHGDDSELLMPRQS